MMSKQSETNPVIIRSVVVLAILTSAAAAAALVWIRMPATRSRRLIDRCDDAINELEHRSVPGFHEFSPSA